MLQNETVPLTGQEIAASIQSYRIQAEKTLVDLQRMGTLIKCSQATGT